MRPIHPVSVFLTVLMVSYSAKAANDTSGVVMSPNYPSPFSLGTQNTVIALADANATVLLHFVKLNMRSASTGYPAWLRIFDGDSMSSPMMVHFQNEDDLLPPDLQSSGRHMTLYFNSTRWGGQNSGYYATYTTVDKHYYITDEVGHVTSPGYPSDYSESESVHWTITQAEHAFVRLEIEDFQTEECCDYLILRNGDGVGSPFMAQLSGEMNQTAYTFLSSGNSMFLRFVSNGFLNGRGFNASYYPGFRYLPGGTTGEVGSLNFPANYTRYLAEQWIITLPWTNMSVLMEFKYFHTELDDIVTIRDGGLENSTIIGVYSGAEIPPTFMSATNKLFISFVSRAGATNQGFFATYISVNPIEYTTTTTTTTSTTTETPICTDPGVYRIPVPGVCEQFYQCVNFNAYLETCAPGMFFDPIISECNFLELVHCPWHTTVATTEPPICPPDGIVYIPVPDDCAAYILCAEGFPQPHRCANGTLFNPETRRCEPAENVDCEVTCPAEGVIYLPKPGSCIDYILCAEGEPIPQRCADGALFDPIDLVCKPADQVVCGKLM